MSSDPQTGLGLSSADSLAAPSFEVLDAFSAPDALAAFDSLSVAEAFFPFPESSSSSVWVWGDGGGEVEEVVWPSFKTTSSEEGFVVDQPSTPRNTS